MAECAKGIPLTSEMEKDIVELSEKISSISKSLDIFFIGKAGSGKSTLCGDILGPDAKHKPTGAMSPRPVTEDTESYQYPLKDDLLVTVYDTRGMLDGHAGGHEEKTIAQLIEVCNNDMMNGVVVVCIPMPYHGRIGAADLAPLSLLHKKVGKRVWDRTVIALTRADRYPKDDWLESKNILELEKTRLRRKFEDFLCETRDRLRECFTANEAKADPSCHIGMTEQEYDELKISILPTSTLKNVHLQAMKLVGHATWFDKLLKELCMKEKGATIIRIHWKRLLNLGEVADLVSVEHQFQPFMKSIVDVPPLLMIWKMLCVPSIKQTINAPRFESSQINEKCVCL